VRAGFVRAEILAIRNLQEKWQRHAGAFGCNRRSG
jgi:hypothetical protein